MGTLSQIEADIKILWDRYVVRPKAFYFGAGRKVYCATSGALWEVDNYGDLVRLVKKSEAKIVIEQFFSRRRGSCRKACRKS
jgi:hypothetical protein